MRSVRRFLRKLDVFGMPYSFRYKNDEKFTTATGGIFFILFSIVVIAFAIYFFIPFYNRQNLNIIYYSMNMPSTDEIKLYKSKANFGIGLDCPRDKIITNLTGDELFLVDLKYVTFAKDHQGNRNVTRYPLSSHKCNYADFYNEFNNSFDIVNMGKLECLDNIDHPIQGIYNDELFSYYEFSVISKDNTSEHYKNIDTYLTTADCKFQLFYTDITIDFNDYEDPIKPYINSLFVQLNPSLFLKMNAFFANQYFENDNYLFFVFNEDEPSAHTLFSRYEEWSLYKGMDRVALKPKDYNTYAKIYIRADTKKTTIKRKYQKVMEFYADSSSLLIALFEVIYFIINYTNGFFADHSLSNQLFFFFFFKTKNFNINTKIEDINKIINLTNPFCTKSSISNKKKDFIAKLDNQEINIYNIKKTSIKIEDKDNMGTEKDFIKPKDLRRRRPGLGRRRKQEINKRLTVVNYDESTNKNIHSNQKKYDITSRANLKAGLGNKIQNSASANTINSMNNYEEEEINFSYNLFEIFLSTLFYCCLPKYLEKKRKLSEKANNLLYEKLDVALYIKNAFLIEVMNQSLIEEKKQGIIKFVTRPIFSYKSREKEISNFYKNYSETDFDKFNTEIIELTQNPKIEKLDQELINLSNKELKNMM